MLVGINAFFVAAAHALVSVRRTVMEQRAREGDRRARRVLEAQDSPDEYVSTAQIGITAATLGIGFLSGQLLYDLLRSPFARMQLARLDALPILRDTGVAAHVVALVLALGLVVCLHAVIGTQVPKMAAVQRAETLALRTVGPMRWIVGVLRPFQWLVAGAAAWVVGRFGLHPAPVRSRVYSPDEIGALVEQSHREGMVEAAAEQMIQGVLELGERVVREVMTPRRDLVAVPVTATLQEAVDLAVQHGHSRLPVMDGDLDRIVGILLVKDLLPALASGGAEGFDLRQLMREAVFVPDTKPVTDLLSELRARKVHMAVVIDEFGGTEGLVTLEDLLEEIVGEIDDEYDSPEPGFVPVASGAVLIGGGVGIDEVNERLGLELPGEDFETVGGYVFGELGRVPVAGDTIALADGGELRVEAVRDRRVTRLRYTPPALAAGRETAPDADERIQEARVANAPFPAGPGRQRRATATPRTLEAW